MVKVVSVKFKGGSKPYYFSPCKQQLEKGMNVIVETSKGLEYATVSETEHEVEEGQVVAPLMPVVRIATQKDNEQVKRNEERRGEALKIAREKIAARGLEMKPVACEFSFDGSKVVIYFTAESRVDFRELIKDLSSAFRMRIELRQIGIRDEIKLMGGLAPCGRECCCVRSLQEPMKVSVKMAKNQGLSLNPGKISGLCGRLMCCLSYENDYYAEVCKQVPKLGGEAETPDGKGTVVNVNMLKMTVKVKIEQGESVSYRDYPLDKIAFMRGNERIGKVGGTDEEGVEAKSDEAGDVYVPSATEEEASGAALQENRNGGNRNRKNNRNRRGKSNNGGNGAKNGADRQQNAQNRGDSPINAQADANANPNGGNRNRNRNRNRKKKHGNNDGAKANNNSNGTDNHKNNG